MTRTSLASFLSAFHMLCILSLLSTFSLCVTPLIIIDEFTSSQSWQPASRRQITLPSSSSSSSPVSPHLSPPPPHDERRTPVRKGWSVFCELPSSSVLGGCRKFTGITQPGGSDIAHITSYVLPPANFLLLEVIQGTVPLEIIWDGDNYESESLQPSLPLIDLTANGTLGAIRLTRVTGNGDWSCMMLVYSVVDDDLSESSQLTLPLSLSEDPLHIYFSFASFVPPIPGGSTLEERLERFTQVTAVVLQCTGTGPVQSGVRLEMKTESVVVVPDIVDLEIEMTNLAPWVRSSSDSVSFTFYSHPDSMISTAEVTLSFMLPKGVDPLRTVQFTDVIAIDEGSYTLINSREVAGVWRIENLENRNASVSITLGIQIQTLHQFAIQARLSNASGIYHTPLPGLLYVEDQVVVTPQGIDLALTKSVDHPFPQMGETIRFSVTVLNNGNVEATGVRVCDPHLEGLEYAADSLEECWELGDAIHPGTGATPLAQTANVTSLEEIQSVAWIYGAEQPDVDSTFHASETPPGPEIEDDSIARLTVNNATLRCGAVPEFSGVVLGCNHGTQEWETAENVEIQANQTVVLEADSRVRIDGNLTFNEQSRIKFVVNARGEVGRIVVQGCLNTGGANGRSEVRLVVDLSDFDLEQKEWDGNELIEFECQSATLVSSVEVVTSQQFESRCERIEGHVVQEDGGGSKTLSVLVSVEQVGKCEEAEANDTGLEGWGIAVIVVGSIAFCCVLVVVLVAAGVILLRKLIARKHTGEISI